MSPRPRSCALRLTGLGAAWRLNETGHANWALYESAAYPGGLATSIVDDEADRLRTLLGPLVFGTDHDNMESAVLAMLEARGHTLGVAESLG